MISRSMLTNAGSKAMLTLKCYRFPLVNRLSLWTGIGSPPTWFSEHFLPLFGLDFELEEVNTMEHEADPFVLRNFLSHC